MENTGSRGVIVVTSRGYERDYMSALFIIGVIKTFSSTSFHRKLQFLLLKYRNLHKELKIINHATSRSSHCPGTMYNH